MTKFERLLLEGGNGKDPLYRKRVKQMAEEHAVEQRKLIEAMEDEMKAKDKEIFELEDMGPKDTTSLDPTEDAVSANVWTSRMHNARARKFFLHHDLKIAKGVEKEYHHNEDLGFDNSKPYTGEDDTENGIKPVE